MTITRARETRVLTALLRRTGLSARDALDLVDAVEAEDVVWTQLRLWLAYTDDDDRVVTRFVVRVGRPREVVGAWGGVTQDFTLRVAPGTTWLRVDADYCVDCEQPRDSDADRHCIATSTARTRTYHRWASEHAKRTA